MKLDLSYKGLTSLDGIDLTGVTRLVCSGNQLSSLPPLQDLKDLKELYCSNNRLTSLPPLQDLKDLEALYCFDNRLTSLPPLPASLKILDCGNNILTLLPPLPAYLEELSCSDNQLTSLPPLQDLKDLERLDWWNNQLTILPDFPWGLKNWHKEKLNQHNRKRADLGMKKVNTLPDKDIWDEINEKHLIWQYRIGGEKWANACNSLDFKKK